MKKISLIIATLMLTAACATGCQTSTLPASVEVGTNNQSASGSTETEEAKVDGDVIKVSFSKLDDDYTKNGFLAAQTYDVDKRIQTKFQIHAIYGMTVDTNYSDSEKGYIARVIITAMSKSGKEIPFVFRLSGVCASEEEARKAGLESDIAQKINKLSKGDTITVEGWFNLMKVIGYGAEIPDVYFWSCEFID